VTPAPTSGPGPAVPGPPRGPADPETGLARRLVALAATAVHAGLPDAAGIAVDVHRRGRPDTCLSAATAVVQPALAALAAPGGVGAAASLADRCRAGGRPGTARLSRPERLALADVGITDVGWVAAVAVPEVDTVVSAWLRRPPSDGDLEALGSARPLVLDTVRTAEDLRDHLVVPPTRLVIEQAKGVLMAHHGVGPDDAFALLRSVSQRRNVPVRDLARVVVDGRAPTRPGGAAAPQVPTG